MGGKPTGAKVRSPVAWIAERKATEFLNPNVRAAYSRAAGAFLRWCEDRSITRIEDVQPVHVAGYIE